MPWVRYAHSRLGHSALNSSRSMLATTRPFKPPRSITVSPGLTLASTMLARRRRAVPKGRFPPIADSGIRRHSALMDISIACLADDWIELQRFDDVEKAPEGVFERGWVLYDLAHENPELAWEAIKNVVGRFDESDLFTE